MASVRCDNAVYPPVPRVTRHTGPIVSTNNNPKNIEKKYFQNYLMHVMFEVKQVAGPAPRPPSRCCWLGARLVKKMLNPKVRWNSRSRNRASQDSETGSKKYSSQSMF